MIIGRLQGGLGNQLFQYAATRALSLQLQASFKLDTITSLSADRQRKVALRDFNAQWEEATIGDIKKFILFPTLYRHHPPLFSRLGKNIYREPHFHFDPGFFQQKDPVFLDGFWQSARYFSQYESVIRSDLTIRDEAITRVKQLAAELSARPTAAVHIRRGDLLNRKTMAFHGVMDAAYYKAAIDHLASHEPGLEICYFSDDISWVKEQLPTTNARYISEPGNTAIEDFYLMSHCRNMVIANSSFSWWAAWLNRHAGRIVIAPRKWFANESQNTADLIPPGWMRI